MRIFKLMLSKRVRVHSLYLIIFFLICFCCISFICDYGIEKILPSLSNKKEDTTVYINWAEKYPFEETEKKKDEPVLPAKNKETNKYLRNILSRVEGLSKCVRWVEDRIPGLFFYRKAVDAGTFASDLVTPDIAFNNGSVAELSSGHLINLEEKTEVDQPVIDHIASLADYVHAKSVPFLYVQTFVQFDPTGKCVSFANENRDIFLSALKAKNVDVLDLRDSAKQENIAIMDHFYKTDHHWTADMGLWSAGKIINKMNLEYHLSMDEACLNPQLFSMITHKNAMFGSLGNFVGRTGAKPEDFSYFVPDYATNFHLIVPSKKVDKTGIFRETLVNQSAIEQSVKNNGDYVYGSFLHGNQSLTKITNLNRKNGLKLLIVCDSFSLCVIPYLACVFEHIDAIDIRPTQGNFNGSVKTYIEKNHPDAVIVMRYSISELIR